MIKRRIQELLEANNAYLERARKAEAERDGAVAHRKAIIQEADELRALSERMTRERDEAREVVLAFIEHVKWERRVRGAADGNYGHFAKVMEQAERILVKGET